MGFVVNDPRRLTVKGLASLDVRAVIPSSGEMILLERENAEIGEEDRLEKLVRPRLAEAITSWNLERRLPDGTLEPLPVTIESTYEIPHGVLLSIWRAYMRGVWEVPEDSPLDSGSTSGDSFLEELETMARSSQSQLS